MLNFRNAFITNLTNPKVDLQALEPKYTSIEELKRWTKDRHGFKDVEELEQKIKKLTESISKEEDGNLH
jgi:adenylosuccinate synthase